MKEFFKKIDWKSGLLYFGFIACETIITATFLSMFIVTPIRFIFKEPGIPREIAELVTFLLVQLLVRFVIFYGLFKNNRNLTYKQFCINYTVTFIIRLVFSLFTSFAAFSAGMAITLLGGLLARVFIDDEIITMQQVPVMLYLAVFVLIEALTLLVILFSSKLAEHKREKVKKELLKEHKNN